MCRIWLLVAPLLVAAACGSTDDTSSGSPPSSETETTTSSTVADSPTTTDGADSAESTTTTALEDLDPLQGYLWTRQTAGAPWSKRAGLRAVELDERILVLGGRTPNQSTIPGDSQIWADVWASDDLGVSWELLTDSTDHWSPRAYFQATTKDGSVYVIGGQDYGLEPNPFCALLEQGLEPPPGIPFDPDEPCPEFFPTSEFFNDVWRSPDGVQWEQMTAEAPWAGRAGLSAAVLGDHIYVMGGSQNDDSSIIGEGGPARIYFNDVWRSTDGSEWEQMNEAAPWEPRAGGFVVASGDWLYLFGGEDGFTCTPLPDCEPPYFNDVWRTTDGATWELVTPSAGWSPRPGHVCELLEDQFVCFGGFGLVENPVDIWTSADGADWSELDAIPWDAELPEQMRYDFDSVVVEGPAGPVLLTFGGDRETFDFADPENYLRVDNDVWIFAPS